jgi:hypothetical protein
MAVTAGAGPPSFIVLANYSPVGGAMTCPMGANSRRRWIAA